MDTRALPTLFPTTSHAFRALFVQSESYLVQASTCKMKWKVYIQKFEVFDVDDLVNMGKVCQESVFKEQSVIRLLLK